MSLYWANLDCLKEGRKLLFRNPHPVDKWKLQGEANLRKSRFQCLDFADGSKTIKVVDARTKVTRNWTSYALKHMSDVWRHFITAKEIS